MRIQKRAASLCVAAAIAALWLWPGCSEEDDSECDGSSGCREGEYCVVRTEVRTHECYNIGEPCFNSGEEYTVDVGTCAPRRGEGQACDDAPCMTGLTCNAALKPGGACALPGQEGAACGRDSDCEPGLLCPNPTPSKCAAAGEPGDFCQDDADCGLGLLCNSATQPSPTCWTKYGGIEGDPCSLRDHCAIGLLCNAAFSPATCKPQQPAGSPCAADADCLAGLLCPSGGKCAEPN